MHSNEIPQWFPSHPPIYDIGKTYEENIQKGPFFNGPVPKRIFPPKSKWLNFLGSDLATPIGIPAGPLFNSKWIKLAAELGFDLLTYKTIRSAEHPAHTMPNMIYVDTHGMLNSENAQKPAKMVKEPGSSMEDLAVTNSFGMPSRSPEFLMHDIPLAQSYLKPGQVMVVSVVASPRKEIPFLEDFVRAAKLAKEAGAKIIEANFSCPNVDKKEGCLYLSADTVFEVASAIVKAIHPLPLILKMGLFPHQDQMKKCFIAAARAGVQAICGINTVSMAVIDEKGQPALGPTRLTSGICGGPIRDAALRFVDEAHQINRNERLDLTLLGGGGITLPQHFDVFLQAGADVAVTATGMMWDPYLAMKYHHLKRGSHE